MISGAGCFYYFWRAGVVRRGNWGFQEIGFCELNKELNKEVIDTGLFGFYNGAVYKYLSEGLQELK